MPNRIAYWRQIRNMSQQQLADALGISQPSIQRIETERQPLTVDLMQSIAKALGVEPIDLLSVAMAAEIRPDLIPAHKASGAAKKALDALGFIEYQATTNALERAGIAAGASCIFNCTEAAIGALVTGDVVAASAKIDELPQRVLILRQYIEPGLLTTNRAGINVAVATDDPHILIEICGVLVSHEP